MDELQDVLAKEIVLWKHRFVYIENKSVFFLNVR